MKSQLKIISAFVLHAFVCLAMISCGMKQMVTGRLVDAGTDNPIEGAAVAIYWVNEKIGPPGLPTPRERLGTTEMLTDAQGEFTIPRYRGFGRKYYMGVYKKGYVCWSSENTFNPRGKTREKIFQKRFWHRVANGMKVKLQPMPEDISTDMREQHAHFTVDVDTRLDQTAIFYKAIKHEKEIHIKSLRRNLEEK